MSESPVTKKKTKKKTSKKMPAEVADPDTTPKGERVIDGIITERPMRLVEPPAEEELLTTIKVANGPSSEEVLRDPDATAEGLLRECKKALTQVASGMLWKQHMTQMKLAGMPDSFLVANTLTKVNAFLDS